MASTDSLPQLGFETTAKPTRQRFFLVAILCIGITVAYLDRVNISVLAANDVFLVEMGIKGQPVKIGMLMSTFLMAYGLANITLSPFGDRLGPRKAMVICIVLWIISLFIGGIAVSFTTMIAARILLGIGEGFYYPMQSVFVKNWFPPQERGRANAAWSIGQSIAPAMAMPFFAYVIGNWGWRESFYVSIAITCVPLYLLWVHTADTPHVHKKVNAFELQYIEEGLGQEHQGEDKPCKDALWQRLRPFIFNYQYWVLVYWYMSMNFVYWGLVSWLPSYLKVARGFSWVEMGWLASLPFILTVMTKAFTGWITDRLRRSAPVLAAGLFLGAICIYLAATVQEKYVATVLLVCAFGFTSMGTPAAWTLLQRLVPVESISTAGGTMNGISTGLSSISPVLLGFFINLTGGYTGGLYVLVVAGFIASMLTAILVIKRY
jgi:sugar phosphate permease